MTRIVLGGLAACWLSVGLSAWRSRRRDVARRMPVRWHRAVSTLQEWSVGAQDDVPVAATWCRPLVQPVLLSTRDLPQQRDGTGVDAAQVSGSRPG